MKGSYICLHNCLQKLVAYDRQHRGEFLFFKTDMFKGWIFKKTQKNTDVVKTNI